MKLKKFKEIIDKAYEQAEGCDVEVEVWLKNSMYDIQRIGQFGVIPTVTITLGQKMFELDNE